MTVAGVSLAVSGAAHADLSAVELQARGEGLAKDGRFSEAIDAFKAADRLEIRASHACLIALAYTRRELWPQAEIWLDICHQRASSGDPLPEWVPEADKQIKDRLADANVAPVEIKVDPSVPDARVTVSSFAPDETFAPRTIHLPPGHHTITVKAAGYTDGERALDIADKTPQQVSITLAAVVLATPGATVTTDPLPRKLLLTGGILIGAGFVSYAVMGYTWHTLDGGTGFGQWQESTYKVTRVTTLGLWGIGAGLAAVGLVLHYRAHGEDRATVSASPIAGGGMVSVGWQR